jgi:hypothetical protein
MAVIQSGASVDLLTVDVQSRAARVALRPLVPSTSTGVYRQGLFTTTMAAALAANAEIMQFRYTGANLCLVRRVTCHGFFVGSTAFGAAASLGSFRLTMNTAWTVDGTGGSVLTTTGEAAQLDSTYAVPVATLRVATTAALSAGTKTPQGITTNVQGSGLYLIPFTATAALAGAQLSPQLDLFGEDGSIDHPQVLRQNEGLAVVATVPGTGTWNTGFTVQWAECTAAEWRV